MTFRWPVHGYVKQWTTLACVAINIQVWNIPRRVREDFLWHSRHALVDVRPREPFRGRFPVTIGTYFPGRSRADDACAGYRTRRRVACFARVHSDHCTRIRDRLPTGVRDQRFMRCIHVGESWSRGRTDRTRF